MLIFPEGNEFVPREWLDDVPVSSWTVPGLVLGAVFGLGSLVAAAGLIWRPRWRWLNWAEQTTGHHWAWTATLLIGLGLLVWIGLEVILIPERNVIELLYGGLAVALIVLISAGPTRSYLARFSTENVFQEPSLGVPVDPG